MLSSGTEGVVDMPETLENFKRREFWADEVLYKTLC